MIKILHNPRCGKSRNCLAFIENSGKEVEVIKYLETTPKLEELKSIIKKLNIKPIELVRQKETIWIENYKDKKMSDDDIIKAMIANPILIERPIVIFEDKAIIGRDLEVLKHFI